MNLKGLVVLGLALLLAVAGFVVALPGIEQTIEGDKRNGPDLVTLNEMAGIWTDISGPRGNKLELHWAKITPNASSPESRHVQLQAANTGSMESILGLNNERFTFTCWSSSGKGSVVFLEYPGNRLILYIVSKEHEHLSVRILSNDIAVTDKSIFFDDNYLSKPEIVLTRVAEADYKPDFGNTNSGTEAIFKLFQVPRGK